MVRRLDLRNQWTTTHHRSGWQFAIGSLAPLHADAGLAFEGFIEKKFAWGRDRGDRLNAFQPIRAPWIGVLHNPPKIPSWFNLNNHHPSAILESDGWGESAQYCVGLFTLSRYLRDWLRSRVAVPVDSLLHPTEEPDIHFDPALFLARRPRRLVQVGWWLRKFHSLYLLHAPDYAKAVVQLGFPWLNDIYRAEMSLLPEGADTGNVERIPYLNAADYDALFASSLVFLDLYDSSANNVIIECIVRHTPVLVNRIDAVTEYLGADYPLFFDDLEEAAAKAADERTVLDAHVYLRSHRIKPLLDGGAFRRSVEDSSILSEWPTRAVTSLAARA